MAHAGLATHSGWMDFRVATEDRDAPNREASSNRNVAADLFELPQERRLFRSNDLGQVPDLPIFHALISTDAVQRLKHVGFLGAIEFLKYGNGDEPHRHRHNRFDHSVGVAALAYMYARERELNEHSTNILVAAALLHDVGHGPLSHTLEPVFSDRFGLSHHAVGNSIIQGRNAIGRSVKETLCQHKTEPDEIIALLEGKSTNRDSFLFDGPMNLDTFEGITRSRYFATSWSASPPAFLIVQALAKDALAVSVLDSFWELKDAVYRLLIHSRMGAAMDAVSQAYMRQHISTFRPDDFYRDERQLRRRHPALFSILRSARSIYAFMRNLPGRLLDQTIELKERRFYVDTSINVLNPNDFRKRYRQTRTTSQLALADILPTPFNSEMRSRKSAQLELIDEDVASH